jgi:hypothetical protein
LRDQYKDFFSTIKRFNGSLKKEITSHLPLIEGQINSILSSVDMYYRGFPSESYRKLSASLNILLKQKLLPIQTVPLSFKGKNFYRIRVSSNKNLTKADLFHIPFQMREKVSTQRYSIPGLPCLYLGDSTFVCWEELGRPNFDNMHIARFDLSASNFKFLFFNISVNDVRDRSFVKTNDGIYISQLVVFLCYWPIFAACSTVVEKPDDVFKPEYIVPQLLLQWLVKTKGIDGIQYKSNRINVTGHSLGTFTNVVIPIKDINESGFCHQLVSKIKLTNPISWQLLDIADPKKESSKQIEDLHVSDLRRAMYIELINGERTNYLNTKFGILEDKLNLMNAGYI